MWPSESFPTSPSPLSPVKMLFLSPHSAPPAHLPLLHGAYFPRIKERVRRSFAVRLTPSLKIKIKNNNTHNPSYIHTLTHKSIPSYSRNCSLHTPCLGLLAAPKISPPETRTWGCHDVDITSRLRQGMLVRIKKIAKLSHPNCSSHLFASVHCASSWGELCLLSLRRSPWC